MIDSYLAALTARIQERIDAFGNSLADGGAVDWADYKRMAEARKQLKWALAQANDLFKRYVNEDEGEEDEGEVQ